MAKRRVHGFDQWRFWAVPLFVIAACGSPAGRDTDIPVGETALDAAQAMGGANATGGRGGGSGGVSPAGGRGGVEPSDMDGGVADGGVLPDANTPPMTNKAPIVKAAAAPGSVLAGGSIELTAMVSDDGIPATPGSVTLLWSKLSGPGDVVFSTPTAASTRATFSSAGNYVLRLTANDGAAMAFADVSAMVAPIAPGLKSWFKFDENQGTTAVDAIANNPAAATVNNMVWAPGKTGASIRCSGEAKTVTIPHSEATDLSRSDLSVSFWLQSSMQSAPNRYPMILTKDGTTERFEILLQMFSDKPAGLIFKYTSTSMFQQTSTPFPLDGQWHHVVARRRGPVISLALDGQVKNSFSLTFTPGVNTAPLWVCGFAEAWGQFFGAIDDLRFYDRALEDSDIALLHSGAQ